MARVRVDLVELLRECVAEAEVRHGGQARRLTLRLPQRALVRGEPEQLRVVFRNLLDNALRHAGSTAPVELSLAPAGDGRLEVVVADHGIGIPRRALRRIFLPFHQLGPEADSRRGLGLGLSIVQNIIRSHGGSVQARSEGVGHGARFVVRLPGSLA